MTEYALIIVVLLSIPIIWYINYAASVAEFKRGYMMGSERIQSSLQLRALRQHLGLSLEQVSNATGLETELIRWMEDCEYGQLRDFDYFQLSEILFNYYGQDKNSASIYVQFDDKVIKLKPCNGFHSLNKRCSNNEKCTVPKSALLTIQEPQD